MKWQNLLIIIFLAFFLAFIIRSFFLVPYHIQTSSMRPSLLPGEFIFAIKKSLFNPLSLKRGNIIVFSYPERPDIVQVKRLIGFGGDRVEIQEGQVSINGRPFEYSDESFVGLHPLIDLVTGFVVQRESWEEGSWLIVRSQSGNLSNFGPLLIPEGEVFVLGDNRDASDDSRHWGTVPLERVEGRVKWIWLSLVRGQPPLGGVQIRWNRLFSTVD